MTSHRPIVLTGFMGTGKSAVGRQLAGRLGVRFIDTDAVIVERHGPIERIFAEQGEAAFRAMEQVVANELATAADAIISTGGRFMLDDHNVVALGSASRVFCLTASVEEIYRRIATSTRRQKRPLLDTPNPKQTIADLLEERAPLYARFPQVASGADSVDQIAADIATLSRLQPARRTLEQGANPCDLLVGVGVVAQLASIVGPDSSTTIVTTAELALRYGPWLSAAGTLLVADPAVDDGATISSRIGLVTDAQHRVVAVGGTDLLALAVTAAEQCSLRVTHCPTSISAMLHAPGIGRPDQCIVDVAALQHQPLEAVRSALGRPELDSLTAPGTLRPLQRAVTAAIEATTHTPT